MPVPNPLRDPNHADAELALRLYDLRREPEMRKAREMVGRLIAGAPWSDIAPIFEGTHPENAHLRQVTSYWEIAASFVNRGILHPDVFLDACGEALFLFSAFRPHLEACRRASSPRFLMQVERLIAEHPAARERLEAIDRMMSERTAAARAKAATAQPVRH
jgi:hypothetical protein